MNPAWHSPLTKFSGLDRQACFQAEARQPAQWNSPGQADVPPMQALGRRWSGGATGLRWMAPSSQQHGEATATGAAITIGLSSAAPPLVDQWGAMWSLSDLKQQPRPQRQLPAPCTDAPGLSVTPIDDAKGQRFTVEPCHNAAARPCRTGETNGSAASCAMGLPKEHATACW